MVAGSMFYIHLLHSSLVEWHYALNGENIILLALKTLIHSLRMMAKTLKHVGVE
jgi:hypothetical protein